MASGGARSISPSTLGNLLECPICLEEIADPRSLPCSHSFCKSCLATYVESSSVSGSSCCPACRKTFVFPEKGIDGIPKSFVLNTLRDSMQKAAIQEIALQHAGAERIAVTWKDCVNTEPDENHGKATKFCKECAEYYCEQCAEGHGRYRATRQHKLLAAEEVSEEDALHAAALVNVPKCTKHPTEDFTLFCYTCKLPICTVCFLSTHKAHDFKELAVVAKEFKSDMNAAIGSTDHFFLTLVSEVEDLNSTATKIEKDMRGAQKLIEKASDEIHKIITRHQKALQDQLDQLGIDARGQVNAAREERQHVIEKMQNQRSLANTLKTIYDQALYATGVRDQLLALCKTTLSTKCFAWKSETSHPSLVHIPANIVGEIAMKKTDGTQTNSTKMELAIPNVKKVQLNATVTGMAANKTYLYITLYNNSDLLVFTLLGKRSTTIPIPELAEPQGLALVSKKDTLVVLIGDYHRKLHIVSIKEDSRKLVSHRFVKLFSNPRGISVSQTPQGTNIIVALRDKRKLALYDLSGSLVKEIDLSATVSTKGLMYAESSRSGGYLVTDDHESQIVLISESGKVINKYTSDPEKLKHAIQDRYGNVLVVDNLSDRVHWLSSDLTFKHYLLTYTDGLFAPRKICLDELGGRLYVAQSSHQNSCLHIYPFSYEQESQVVSSSTNLTVNLATNKMQENAWQSTH